MNMQDTETRHLAGRTLAELAASARAKKLAEQTARMIQAEASVSALTQAARRYSTGGVR